MNNIIDLHCDTILKIYNSGENLKANSYHLDLNKMQRSGYLAQCFALFIDIYDEDNKNTYHSDPWELYKKILSVYKEAIIKNNDIILPAFSAEDVLKNAEKKKISSILTIEDGALLDNHLERVPEVYEDGVRLLTFTWNYENSIGYPNSPEPDKHMRRLKPFGLEVIRECNKLGILIDVSHLSEGGFNDVCKYSEKPFLASHSCSRSLCSHQRNLTDQQLRSLADAGGVVGINFYSYFLKDDEPTTYSDDIIRHILHIYNTSGIESIAWGSDFDGIDSVVEFQDAGNFPILLSKLEKHFTDDQIEKINYKNFLRVWSEQK